MVVGGGTKLINCYYWIPVLLDVKLGSWLEVLPNGSSEGREILGTS